VSAPRHVVVVGGGFAGLAAAVRLGVPGARVTLLERRPFLGGRAYSFTDGRRATSSTTGPHAFMGAYTALADFCAEIGAPDAIAFQPRLHVPMAHPVDGPGAVAAPAVPGPLQGPAALMRYGLLSRAIDCRSRSRPSGSRPRRPTRSSAARRRGARGLPAVGGGVPALLGSARHRDAERDARARGGGAVCGRAPRGFLAGARAARFGVARGPLGDAFAAPGVQPRSSATGGRSARTRRSPALDVTGGRLDRRRAARRLAHRRRRGDPRRPAAGRRRLRRPIRCRARRPSPIVSVHLWTDETRRSARRPPARRSSGLLETRAQWLFDCGRRARAAAASRP
jgi:hypothetical protein